MIIKKDKNKIRKGRHYRVRNKVNGTAARPRLNVYRSTVHIYAQVIDDVAGVTLVSSSTLEKTVKEQIAGKDKKQAASIVGAAVAKQAIAKGIKEVVFDRGGYLYAGRVEQLADGARKAGLKF